MSGKRMIWLLCAALLLVLTILPALAETDEIVLTFGGDCVLGTREQWKKKKNTFDTVVADQGMEWCFEKIREPFETDDLSTVNLEVVLQKDSKGHERSKQFTFRGDPSYTEILSAASIEHVNLANNHYIDFGRPGRASTVAALEAGGIAYSGYTYRYVTEIRGHKIGFGGCRETVWQQKPEIMREDLQALREEGCEVIVYSCHWGKEYAARHNERQEKMAREAIDGGADLVIGTHPHVVQGVDAQDGAVIVYSLGNLVFGGTHKMKTFDGLLVQAALRFDEQGYAGVSLRLLPVLTSGSAPENDFRPVFAQGEDAARILGAVQKDSPFAVSSEMWFPAR